MRQLVRVAFVLFSSASLVTACEDASDSTPGEAPPVVTDTTGLAAEEAAVPDSLIPVRGDEIGRDEGSHPQEVMDFLGIDQGDKVADLIAGDGYYTYLLSQRVGPTGRVYAQGYSPGLEARLDRGDLEEVENVVLVDSLSALPAGELEAVLLIRAYHLFEEPQKLLAELDRALAPGGTVGVVELRLGRDEGHDMETHRMGEQTVIDEFRAGGFELLATSDTLRNPDDDHTDFWEGRRHLADRMLLKFAKPGEPAPATPPTARRSS